MEYVSFGRTGTKVSKLCLGMMTFGTPGWRDYVMEEGPSRPIIKAAVDAGINFFDTADVYARGGSEEVTGKVLGSLLRRHEYVLATKVCNPMSDDPNDRGLSRKHIMESIDASLQRLGTDYVDLYIIHRWDYSTPIEETMEALHDVVRAGKALYLGASSMFAWQFLKAQSAARQNGWTPFVSMQNHYNLIYREEEREMIPLCLDQGVGLIPWSPLARGFFAGNRDPEGGGSVTKRAQTDAFAHRNYFRENDFVVAATVEKLAHERGVSPTQLACAWVLQAPGVTSPIIGATKVHHLQEVFEAVDIELSAEEVARLEEPYQPHPVLGHVQPSPKKMVG